MTWHLVLDSMIWAQAAANPLGRSGQIVRLARERRVSVIVCAHIGEEVRLALQDPYFVGRLGGTFDASLWLDTTMAACAEQVDVTGPLVLQEHAKDGPILWLAVAGGASHLVTWEQRLLDLEHHRFTRVVTPIALLRAWRDPAAHEPLADWQVLRGPGRVPRGRARSPAEPLAAGTGG